MIGTNDENHSLFHSYIHGTVQTCHEAKSGLWQLRYIRALQEAGIADCHIARAWEISPSTVQA